MSIESADGARGAAWRIAAVGANWQVQHGAKVAGSWGAWTVATAQATTRAFEGQLVAGTGNIQARVAFLNVIEISSGDVVARVEGLIDVTTTIDPPLTHEIWKVENANGTFALLTPPPGLAPSPDALLVPRELAQVESAPTSEVSRAKREARSRVFRGGRRLRSITAAS